MSGTFEFIGAFSPGLIWLWYIHRKDRHEPEPTWLVTMVFGFGGVATFAMLRSRLHLEELLPEGPPLARSLVDAFVVTALSEELLKVTALILGVAWIRYLDEPMDGIIYGAAAGLGFASVENALYLASSGDLSVLLMRAFTATILHACLTAGIGFCLAMARLHPRRWQSWLLALVGFLTAVILHGLYDLFLFAWPEWKMISLLFVLPLVMAALGLITSWAQKAGPRYLPAA